MKDLNALYERCLWEVERVGIRHGVILDIKVNYRAKTRWGMCKRNPNGFMLEISAMLLEDSVSDEAAKDTIIHEILHTCKGAFNHGEAWKALAGRMNAIYGYNIKRTTSYAEKGMKEVHVEDKYKYFYKCEGCGQILKYKRKCVFTKNPARYRCGICGGKFIEAEGVK